MRYLALSVVDYDRRYQPGEPIEMKPHEAKSLLADGAIEPAPAGTQPGDGLSPFYRERLIRLAVMALPEEGNVGRPTVQAVRQATGLKDVSAAECDEAAAAAQGSTGD